MYNTGLIQLIFFITAAILYILGLYFVFVNKKLKMLGIILTICSILYFGLSLLIFNAQSETNSANSSNPSTAATAKNVTSSGSTPTISSSIATASRFLNIPIMPLQNIPIQSAAAIVSSDLSQNTNSGNSFNITAKVDNPNPTMGQSVNVIVNGPPGANVYAIANYKNASVSNSGVIGSDGTVKISFSMGNGNPGDTVNVDVNAVLNNNTSTAQTSFTEAN